MGRNDSEAWRTIHSTCNNDKINEKNLYNKSKLVLSKYRKFCWQTKEDADDTVCDLCVLASSDVDGAMVYLETFSPENEKEVFESRIKDLFDRRWMIDIVDTAMMKTREFPDCGELYFEIISKCYLTKWKYTEDEMLEALNLERSRFYDRKKEAIMIFGISLWGTAIRRYRKFMCGESDSYPT